MLANRYGAVGHECLQCFDIVHIALYVLALLVRIAVEVVIERTQDGCPVGVRIAKERQGLVRLFFEIAEANDVARVLH